MTGVALAAASCAALAVACVGIPGLAGAARRRPGERLAAVRSPLKDQAPQAGSGSGRQVGPAARWSAGAVVLLAGTVVIGGAAGLVAGLVAALAVVIVRPATASPGVDPDEVAVVVDLMAGCLAAGTGLPAALDAASVAADETLQRSCRLVAAALRNGSPPDEAWQSWLADPWLAPVARTAVRTSHSGAAAAADLRRTAVRLRARRRAAAQYKVQRAAVWLVAPLGLFFLPAFVLVAVVPLVLGLLPSLR